MVDYKYPWGDNFRYNSYANRLRDRFGERIQKVSVKGAFTCPNRDGTVGYGGCSFCLGESFVPSYCKRKIGLQDQIDAGIAFQKFRYRHVSKYIGYLQAYSNTYAGVKELRQVYNEILDHPAIYGLCISTRPDCINEEVLDLLEELSGAYPIFVELGIESCYDKTLALMNRGHDFSQSVKAVVEVSKRRIPVTAHLIFGLPGETKDDMLREVPIISGLPLTSVKFHQLQIFPDAPVYALYKEDPGLFLTFTLESYCEFIADILERLNPSIAVERFAAEAPLLYQVANGWDQVRAEQVGKKIESVMEFRSSCQGIRLKNH